MELLSVDKSVEPLEAFHFIYQCQYFNCSN